MWENIDRDRHYLGEFQLDDETLQGEIIYNKADGVIILKFERRTDDTIGKTYGRISLITGTLHSGTIVSLYNNKCIDNHTYDFAYQRIVFKSDYLILGHTQGVYNRLVCELENGLRWSRLSRVDLSDFATVKLKGIDEHIYHWFRAKIKFSTTLKNELFSFPRKEVSRVIERLVVEIEAEEKRDVSFFMQVRDKVISLISFAIKDNVNIEDQYLVDFDDRYEIGGHKEYTKKPIYSSEPHYHISNTALSNYNFTLSGLTDAEDIQDSLIKLEPVFNLYLSLFRYQHMPPEMVFLNMVQALETFHSRFFYDNKKEKYIESVYQRFGNGPQFGSIKELLLSDTQIDENCN